MANDWRLPEAKSIRLDRDELLLIDFHLSGHYLCNVGRGLEIGEIIGTWHDFRIAVWDGIKHLETIKPSVHEEHRLSIDEGTAKYLFNWLPPTFMWGTGRDCGFSLKVKLHNFLIGAEEVPLDNQDATESGPKDPPIPFP